MLLVLACTRWHPRLIREHNAQTHTVGGITSALVGILSGRKPPAQKGCVSMSSKDGRWLGSEFRIDWMMSRAAWERGTRRWEKLELWV